jgi:hypothetical protein
MTEKEEREGLEHERRETSNYDGPIKDSYSDKGKGHAFKGMTKDPTTHTTGTMGKPHKHRPGHRIGRK